MAPLAPHERVLVSQEFFKDVHAEKACEECHGGNPAAVARVDAHKGVVKDPTEVPPFGAAEKLICAECHEEQVEDRPDLPARDALLLQRRPEGPERGRPGPLGQGRRPGPQEPLHGLPLQLRAVPREPPEVRQERAHQGPRLPEEARHGEPVHGLPRQPRGRRVHRRPRARRRPPLEEGHGLHGLPRRRRDARLRDGPHLAVPRAADAEVHGVPRVRAARQGRAAQGPRRQGAVPGLPLAGLRELLQLPHREGRQQGRLLREPAGGGVLQDRPQLPGDGAHGEVHRRAPRALRPGGLRLLRQGRLQDLRQRADLEARLAPQHPEEDLAQRLLQPLPRPARGLPGGVRPAGLREGREQGRRRARRQDPREARRRTPSRPPRSRSRRRCS